MDVDEVGQDVSLHFATAVSLLANSGVAEGSCISSPLVFAIGIWLNDRQVVKQTNNCLLLSSTLVLRLSKGLTDKKLATVVKVLLINAFEHHTEVKLGCLTPFTSLLFVMENGKNQSRFCNSKASNSRNYNSNLSAGKDQCGSTGND